MILEAVREHYVKLLGEPSRVAHFKNPGASVEILKWEADRHPEGSPSTLLLVGAADLCPV
jgi:hypothetical protein